MPLQQRSATFRAITMTAGIGADRTPGELRHSFVSVLSDNGVTIEAIADLVSHKTTIATQKVHRHYLKSVITTGAATMNTVFNGEKGTESVAHVSVVRRSAQLTSQRRPCTGLPLVSVGQGEPEMGANVFSRLRTQHDPPRLFMQVVHAGQGLPVRLNPTMTDTRNRPELP